MGRKKKKNPVKKIAGFTKSERNSGLEK